ncbi:MAG: DUF2000 domain-containing protein [Clostridia bacterium]|nr:DUF2000 domain-containing protein [Clostridia bacterium]
MKCVMIVNEDLPRGIIANTTAALGISIASLQGNMTGKPVVDGNDRIHESITNIPIPILALPIDDMKALYDDLLENSADGIKVIGFSDVAQKSHHYDDYEAQIQKLEKDDIRYLGLCLYGPKIKINKLTGSMKILR